MSGLSMNYGLDQLQGGQYAVEPLPRPSSEQAPSDFGQAPAQHALPQAHSRTSHTGFLEQRGGPQRRYLTELSSAAGNHGYDNENSDLILAVEDVLLSREGRRYIVKDMLGQGTFGQVVKCMCEETGELVAVKIIKNQTAFYHQARVEVGVLQYLNNRGDPEDRHHIVRMRDYFVFRNHLCLAFELLSVNLYELVKHNRFKGLSLTLLRVFIAQILDALTVLRDSNIVHCDLKPENVLLKSLDSGDIKVIDFGSACFENRTMYSYIQSRFYRSPEVLMGYPYNVAIDMWSLGCMAAELFLGLPLFPGASEHDLLVRIVEMLGPLPEYVLQKAQHTTKYFRKLEEPMPSTSQGRKPLRYQLRSQAEFEVLHGQQAPAGKRYFQHTKLADIIGAYPLKSGLSDEEMAKESERREAFLDFLMGVLDLDPDTRWSPKQALQHPFITNQPFKGPFQPSPDPHVPIRNTTAGFQPGSTPAGSPFGLAVSPYSTMMATSPEAHAQAHAAALAAVNAHFSPRTQGSVPANLLSLRRPSLQGEVPSPMSTSYTNQPGGQATPARRSSIPTPAAYPGGTPSSSQLSGYDAVQWSQLSPHFPTAALSPMNSGSLMRQNSLAAVLAPWTQQAPPAVQPVGSLEALRHTWRAPHNSYARSNAMRMASGNLQGLGMSVGSIPSGDLGSMGLPPLPSGYQSTQLQHESSNGAGLVQQYGLPSAADLPQASSRRSSLERTHSGASAGPSNQAAYQDPAQVMAAIPDEYAPYLGLGTQSHPSPSAYAHYSPPLDTAHASQQAHAQLTVKQQLDPHYTPQLAALGARGGQPGQAALGGVPSSFPSVVGFAPPPSYHASPSHTAGAGQWLDESAYRGQQAADGQVRQQGGASGVLQAPAAQGGHQRSADYSGAQQPLLFSDAMDMKETTQNAEGLTWQQRLTHLHSGDLEAIPEPSDWDPTYSDELLLNEEASRASQEGMWSRPLSGGTDALRMGRSSSQQQREANTAWQQGLQYGYEMGQEAAAYPTREGPTSQLDFRQQVGSSMYDGGNRHAFEPSSLSATGAGAFPGWQSTWLHPSLSSSIYTLPEQAPLTSQPPLPSFSHAQLDARAND